MGGCSIFGGGWGWFPVVSLAVVMQRLSLSLARQYMIRSDTIQYFDPFQAIPFGEKYYISGSLSLQIHTQDLRHATHPVLAPLLTEALLCV